VVSTIIPKIINVLRNMRKYLDWIYKNLIRPMMNWIQKARRVLAIAKALHIPFAAKLDRILGQIQSHILGPFLMLVRWFNGYGYWLNAIVTNHYTLQKPLFIRTMTAYQGDWINMWWNAQTPGARPATGAAFDAGAAAAANAKELDDFHAYATAGAGPYAENEAAARQILLEMNAGV
jgi:hypothetical protein